MVLHLRSLRQEGQAGIDGDQNARSEGRMDAQPRPDLLAPRFEQAGFSAESD